MAKPWTPVYWNDYAADTVHLSMEHEGAYICLMRYCYTKKTPIIKSKKDLLVDNCIAYCIAKALQPAQQKIVDEVLQEFFEWQDGVGWYHNRIAKELENSENKYNARVSAAAKSHEQRHRNAKNKQSNMQKNSNASCNANAMQLQSQPQPHTDLKEDTNVSSKKFVLPDWLDKNLWQAFKDHRKQIKKPMTDYAQSRMVAKLQRMCANGYTPEELLNLAIEKGWQDIYEPKKGEENAKTWGNAARPSGKPTKTQSVIDAVNQIAGNQHC